MCERRKKTSLETIKDEIKVAHPLMSEALEELERDSLIAIQENSISLTELGQESAENILEKHLVLEDYFEKKEAKLRPILQLTSLNITFLEKSLTT